MTAEARNIYNMENKGKVWGLVPSQVSLQPQSLFLEREAL